MASRPLLFSVVLTFVFVACGDNGDPSEGRPHELGCESPLLVDDFLTSTLDEAWEPRSGTNGSRELVSEGSGAERRGFVAIADAEAHADISPSDRSAYAILRPAPSGDFQLRAMFIEAPIETLHVTGVLLEQNQDNLVGLAVRGSNGFVQPELMSFVDGQFRVGGSGELTTADRVLIELSRQGNEWSARVNGEDIGGGDVPIGADLRVGPYVGSPQGQSAESTLEWIEICP